MFVCMCAGEEGGRGGPNAHHIAMLLEPQSTDSQSLAWDTLSPTCTGTRKGVIIQSASQWTRINRYDEFVDWLDVLPLCEYAEKAFISSLLRLWQKAKTDPCYCIQHWILQYEPLN